MLAAVGIVFLGVEFEPNAQRYVNYIVPSSGDGHTVLFGRRPRYPQSGCDRFAIQRCGRMPGRSLGVPSVRPGDAIENVVADLAAVSGLAGCVQVSF
jgi:hypothetical protein